MRIVNIHEAKTHFSKLVNAVLQGEEIVIAKSGHPLIKLMPYTAEPVQRKGGQLKGMFLLAENFDAPLPQKILRQFYEDKE
ncbi:MAG: antitoxin [Gammaproteobacteria bacterium RIFCSPHIGHO2_12_FULL_41_15]|nr:MAG: antitoxin [Gammaproteobacteria bacterium RIFCSPHIGHO2_12_FULL_41_15]